jgi:hypothetical protein
LEEEGINPSTDYFLIQILLMTEPKSSSRIVASASHFVKYEPHLAEELKQQKPANCRVSGRLLSVLYNRLLFWSKYSKHRGTDGKRYFWKSINELSTECGYSTKSIERALYVLVELKMIIREKLAKHHYRQVWFYHLPNSPFQHDIEPSTSTNRSRRNTNGTETRTKHQQNIHQPPAPIGALPTTGRNAVGIPPAPIGAGLGSMPVPAPNASIQRKVRDRNEENVCMYQQNHSTRKNTLWEIVEKCELYGQQGIEKVINGGRTAGLGFG